MSRVEQLKKNYEQVLEELKEACVQARRNPEEVKLVAVSKKHSSKDIEFLAQLGQKDFGENYVQEVLAKQEELKNLSLNCILLELYRPIRPNMWQENFL